MAKAAGFGTTAVLRVALGLFFVTLGITGIIPQAGEGIFSLSAGYTPLEIAFGVIEVLCGAFFLLDAFKRVPRKTSIVVIVVILVIWLARIAIAQVLGGVAFVSTGIVFKPAFWPWLLTIVTELLIASGIWTLYKVE
jgi:hypothetical protein